MKKKIVTLNLNYDIIEEIDIIIKEKVHYASRAHFIKVAIDHLLKTEKQFDLFQNKD